MCTSLFLYLIIRHIITTSLKYVCDNSQKSKLQSVKIIEFCDSDFRIWNVKTFKLSLLLVVLHIWNLLFPELPFIALTLESPKHFFDLKIIMCSASESPLLPLSSPPPFYSKCLTQFFTFSKRQKRNM